MAGVAAAAVTLPLLTGSGLAAFPPAAAEPHVIKATAQTILRASRELSAGTDFIGHIGGDDFIVLTEPDRMEALAKLIIAHFAAAAPSFYHEEDRKRGKIHSTDRQGRKREFPLLSISIGICHNQLRQIHSHAQVSQIGTELKKHAKEKKGSAYVIDRRRD